MGHTDVWAFGHMGVTKCMGDIQMYRLASTHMRVSEHMGASKVWGHPNIQGASKVWGASKCIGDIQMYGASKGIRASKHMGASEGMAGVQMYEGIQIYRGHPNMWDIWTPPKSDTPFLPVICALNIPNSFLFLGGI